MRLDYPGTASQWRTAMEEYIGLDVSMKETAVSIRRAGQRIWRGKCASDPSIIAELIRA
jgi:transposase